MSARGGSDNDFYVYEYHVPTGEQAGAANVRAGRPVGN